MTIAYRQAHALNDIERLPTGFAYRSEIDGLRAIAILPVILYHAGIPGFTGGFVGVDVFFVISGFLMTTLITGELERGRFSLLRFYERRVRRILPALFAMISVCVIAAWYFLMPVEMEHFARSVRAAALFSSNIQFRNESNYFDIAAHTKPLLHTWSLAVEEQFYILFPVLLMVIQRFAPKRLMAIIGILFLVSLAASAWMVTRSQASAFYLLQFRAWELLLGALIALIPLRGVAAILRELLVTIGLVMIAVGVFGFTDRTTFPGLSALVPCLGAALVIAFAKESQGPARLLRSRPMVFVGLISYSLYLWHWPLIVFFPFVSGHALTTAEGWLVVAGSVCLATGSWVFVERPFRGTKSRIGRRALIAGALTCGTTAIVFGALVTEFKGAPGRLPGAIYKVYAATYDTSQFGNPPCFIDWDNSGITSADVRAGRLCPVGTAGKGTPTFLVWGDSHAGAMTPAIDEAARRAGVSGLFAGHGSCPPLPDLVMSPQSHCNEFNTAVRDLVTSKHIPLVILVAYWPKYVHAAELPNQGVYFDPSIPPPVSDESAPIARALDKLLTDLRASGTKVVLVHDVPEMGRFVPEAAAKAKMIGASQDIAPPWEYVMQRQVLSRALVTRMAVQHNAGIVDPLPAFCSNGHCDAVRDGLPLYKDADHITAAASRKLSHLFDPIFNHRASTSLETS
ncbi:peptidoglycan/LPS O-acetylase OafA/YrhL [Rhizobium mesoamericanum]|uniref:acyltransferase family protein n=1 Tax=Rhizobium mesoamericanum TaxID=1079800 RepID=UPI00277ED2E1|nr:acyltransferase family protein [Rhizobium mesoamericanum]MDQ0561970.1 peptidoglycan/LPS O-acetylase OafA/YrhL [Rhizobium mesoamericanum]